MSPTIAGWPDPRPGLPRVRLREPSSQTSSASSSSASEITSGTSTRMQFPATPPSEVEAARRPAPTPVRRARSPGPWPRPAGTSSTASIHRDRDVADLGASAPATTRRRDRISLADGGRPLDQALLFDHVEHRERGASQPGCRRRCRRRPPASGASMISRPPEDSGEGQAHRDRLRDRDQVGLDAEVLDREEAAGAPEAGLHLVADKDDAVLVADLAQALYELARGRDEAAFALHGLEHDRGDVLGRDERRESARAPPAPRRPRPAVGVGRARGRPRARRGRAPACTGCVLEVSASDREVRPWKAPSNPITAGRPVKARANLTAFSTASLPALKNAALRGPREGTRAADARPGRVLS